MDIERLRMHPDNKTKANMQQDCDLAADEIQRQRDELQTREAELAACKAELTTLLKISACPAESHEPEEGDTETIKRFRQICKWMHDQDKELTAAKAELEATKGELARYQWQPIETAPKDGSHILVIRVRNDVAGYGYWGDEWVYASTVAHYLGGEFWPSWGHANMLTQATLATHWMPLPPAPNAEGGA